MVGWTDVQMRAAHVLGLGGQEGGEMDDVQVHIFFVLWECWIVRLESMPFETEGRRELPL